MRRVKAKLGFNKLVFSVGRQGQPAVSVFQLSYKAYHILVPEGHICLLHACSLKETRPMIFLPTPVYWL